MRSGKTAAGASLSSRHKNNRLQKHCTMTGSSWMMWEFVKGISLLLTNIQFITSFHSRGFAKPLHVFLLQQRQPGDQVLTPAPYKTHLTTKARGVASALLLVKIRLWLSFPNELKFSTSLCLGMQHLLYLGFAVPREPCLLVTAVAQCCQISSPQGHRNTDFSGTFSLQKWWLLEGQTLKVALPVSSDISWAVTAATTLQLRSSGQ